MSTKTVTKFELPNTHNGTKISLDLYDNRYEDDTIIYLKIKKPNGIEQNVRFKICGNSKICEINHE